MQQAKAFVLWGYGINCEREVAIALKKAGCGSIRFVHINELMEGETLPEKCNIFVFPGGFLDGDHLGAAKACANRFLYGKVKRTGKTVLEHLIEFVESGGYIVGICNGFQLLVKMGLLPALDGNYGDMVLTLSVNDSGRFEDRWAYLKVLKSKSIFTEGMERLYLPIRHGEGKLIAKDEKVVRRMFEEGHVVLQYADPSFEPTMEYPFNPNGSVNSIAGVCDPTGRILGLMPHPEAFHSPYNHPLWPRGEWNRTPMGTEIFRNVVKKINGERFSHDQV